MPTITIDKERFCNSFETRLTDEELMNILSELGTDVENITEKAVEIEIFPNRPDMLSIPGLVRNVRGLLGEETGIKQYPVQKAEKTVNVTEDVKPVRPKTACAIVKDLNLTKDLLDELITLQEKIHITYGRNRKKCALGLYPLNKIEFPVTYTALPPSDISFTPLGSETTYTANEILEEHEKGKQYKSLLKGKPKFPVFIDNSNDFLSLPPIINSDTTGQVTTKTKDLFIECSGFSQETVTKALNIVTAHLADLDGKISRVEVSYPEEKALTPEIDKKEQHSISYKEAKNWLGVDLTKKEMEQCLEKMRHETEKAENPQIINVNNATYRTDILGETDFFEEIAIGYGYNNIEPDTRREYTKGKKESETKKEEKVRNLLIGSQFQEIYTYSLCNIEQTRRVSEKDVIPLKNSLSERYNGLRPTLIENHLKTLSDNTQHSYPQRFFEIGPVFLEDKRKATNVKQESKMTITVAGSSDAFSTIQSLLVRVGQILEQPITFSSSNHPAMIEGRTASLIINNNDIGVFGEIHPKFLEEYDVNQPVTIAEIAFDTLTK